MKRLITACLIAVLFFAALSRCGTAADSESGTPAIDIPAPISHLSASSPDAQGLARVTGEAGFADAGTTVTLTVSATASATDLLLRPFLPNAFAQIAADVTAAADGSFQTEIAALAGATLSVAFTKDGAAAAVETEIPDNQPPLPLGADLQDAAVHGAQNLAALVANDGTDGVLYLIDTQNASLTDTIDLPGAAGAFRVSVDPQSGNYAVLDSANDLLWEIDAATGATESTAVPDPADIAAGLSGGFAVLSHGSGAVGASYFDLQTNTGTAVEGVAGVTSHQRSYFVATDRDGAQDVFALVSLMSDNVIYVFRFEIADDATVTQTASVALDGLANPAGLALFGAGREALVTDCDNDRVLRVDFASGATSAIAVGDDPRGVTVPAGDDTAYVVNFGDRTVSAISLADDAVTTAAALGLAPTEIASDRAQSGSPAAIANTGDATATILR